MMKKRTLKSFFLLWQFLLSFSSNAESSTGLHYRSTGSLPLLYRVSYDTREEVTTEESLVRLNQNQVAESQKQSVQRRRLTLEKKVRRELDVGNPGQLATRIESLIQSEEKTDSLPPLESERTADFFQTREGSSLEPYSIEAFSHFGIPVLLPEREEFDGTSWKGNWRLLMPDGSEQILTGSYRIEQKGHLAGHLCLFVRYQISSDPLLEDQWVGEGRFAFDLEKGFLVVHEGHLIHTRSEQYFQESGKITQKRRTDYELAEVIVH